jgi:hypothetical protein
MTLGYDGKMRRLGFTLVSTTLAGLLSVAACGDDAQDPPNAGAPDAGSDLDGTVGTNDGAVDAPVDANLGPPLTVLSTTDDIRDIAVLGGTLYVLAAKPSRIETCSAAGCTARTLEVATANMPEEVLSGTMGPQYHENSRIVVLPLGTAEGIVVAQEGNNPCAEDCTKKGLPTPAIYDVGATRPPTSLYAMSFPEFTKGANRSVVDDIRGDALWYDNSRNNEGPSRFSKVLLRFGPSASNTALEIKTLREDTRNGPGPTQPTPLPGALLAGAHRDGRPYISQSLPSQVLNAVDSAGDASTDTLVGVGAPTFLATTANLRFMTTATTPMGQVLMGAKAANTTETVVSLPKLTSAHRLIGTELGLFWYLPLTEAALDAGTGGPLALEYCADAMLGALATGSTCDAKTVMLDLDEITRIKDEGAYLYALGRKDGQTVVVRFAP